MIAKKLRSRFSWRSLLIYVYFEGKPGRRSAAGLISLDRSLRLFGFGLLGRFFDRRHIGVRQAEMMANLMHQHMFDDGAKRLVVPAQ